MTELGLARKFAAVVLVCGVAAISGWAAPAAAKPKFAAIAVDAKTGKILFSRNADNHRYPASLTKVMTLYVLFQEMKAGRIKKNTRLLVSKFASQQQPSRLGLKPGSWITAENAIKALVTKSANDVAVVVAESIAGNQRAFAERMTRTARYLGMTRTRFRNASGLPDNAQLTTARDMATLGLRIQRDFPRYYRYFKIRKFVYKGRTYHTHNRLLGRYWGTDGIKTGYTRASGYNLTSSVRRGGRHVVGVVMGAKSGRSRNSYMQSMLTRAFKRVPRRNAREVANTAGRPPGLKAAASPGLLASPPLPAPKPLTTQTASVAQTISPVTATDAAPPIPAPTSTVQIRRTNQADLARSDATGTAGGSSESAHADVQTIDLVDPDRCLCFGDRRQAALGLDAKDRAQATDRKEPVHRGIPQKGSDDLQGPVRRVRPKHGAQHLPRPETALDQLLRAGADKLGPVDNHGCGVGLTRLVQCRGVRRKDMAAIFDDERRETGPIWPNPIGTRPIWPLDIVAKGLQWPTLRRLPRLASGQMGHANATTMIVHRP